METYEQRLAAWEGELRDKYTQKERDEAADKGHAMDGGSYIIEDQDDLEKAIKAVGRGNSDHDTIRKHVITQAARLKLSKLIPENWNADGSLADEEQKAAVWDAEHRDGMSYGDVRDMLSSAVAAKFATGDNNWCYVLDFGDDWLVYEANDGEMLRCSYSVDGSDVTLGKPEPVHASTTYSPMESKGARNAPTPEDSGITYGLGAVKQALAGVKAKQLADPDNATDPDDADVMAGIEAAEKALDKAIVAQSKDGHADRSARPRRKERRRAVPLMPEVRFWQADGLEVRSSKTTDEIIITGTPIVYNAPYTVTDMFGEFEERMLPGVATGVLDRGADVRFLFNHDGLPLARTTSGTLTLNDSSTALQMVARLDARQQLANDLAIATERGDVSQMSCGFIVARDRWDDAMEHRDVAEFADLLDVSSVTYPASPTTATQVAQRMALMAPIESRARLRQFIVAERSGAVLSGASKAKVASAIEALHGLYEAGGGNVAELIEPDGSGADLTESQSALDGSGERSDPLVDPGEKVRTKTSFALRMEIEGARKRQRVAA